KQTLLQYQLFLMIRIMAYSPFASTFPIDVYPRFFYSGYFLKDWDCGYASYRKNVVTNTESMNCDIRYRFGNTLRFPRVTREPPRTTVLWGLTLGLRLLAPPKTMATIPAGVFVYFLRWFFCKLITFIFD